MPQSQSPLNPWLVSYIKQHHNQKSRYEIDSYLIQAGYNPAEIEVVWKTILSVKAPGFVTKEQALIIAQSECARRGWFWVESARVTSHWQNWKVDSMMKCSWWYFYIDRRTGEVKKARFMGYGRGRP
jgi:hypothetical protein